MNLLTSLACAAVAQHEAFLVVADGGADHLFGNMQEALIERAHQHHRPFDQAGDFRQQPFVFDQLEPLREGKLLGLGENDIAPALGVRHHLGLVELLQIIGEPAHGEWRRRHKAMAARLVADGNAVDRERHDVRLLGLRTKRGDDRMQRPHPVERARLFRLRAPAHGFRPGEGLDHLAQDFGDHIDGGAAGLLDHRDVKVALLVGLHLRFADRCQPRGLEKARDRILRRADARALLLFAHVGLAVRHAVHRKRQPPRRHERLGAFVDETGIDQAVGNGFAQILRRPRLHARRNFFGEKFEQKIRHELITIGLYRNWLANRDTSGPQLIWIRIGNISNDALWRAIDPQLDEIIQALSEGERIVEVL